MECKFVSFIDFYQVYGFSSGNATSEARRAAMACSNLPLAIFCPAVTGGLDFFGSRPETAERKCRAVDPLHRIAERKARQKKRPAPPGGACHT